MTRPEMPIFSRTFDLMAWLLPATHHFPRPHRHTFTKRLLDALFDLRERLEEANLRSGSRGWSAPTRLWPGCASTCAWRRGWGGFRKASTNTSQPWFPTRDVC